MKEERGDEDESAPVPAKDVEEERHLAAGLVFEKHILPPHDSGVGITNLTDFQRLERHLSTLREKVTLYEDIMSQSSDGDEEALNEIAAFLEACQRRLPDIIEAGTMGMLCEGLLAEAVEVNDLVSDITIQHHKLSRPIEESEDQSARRESLAKVSTAPVITNSIPLPGEVEDAML